MLTGIVRLHENLRDILLFVVFQFSFAYSRDYFYQFGEIRSLNVLPAKACAFIAFTTRQAAEKAAERSFNKLVMHGLYSFPMPTFHFHALCTFPNRTLYFWKHTLSFKDSNMVSK